MLYKLIKGLALEQVLTNRARMTFYNEVNSSSDAYKTLHEEEAGAFGTVQACQDTETGTTIAIKYLKRVSTCGLQTADDDAMSTSEKHV